VCVCVCARVCVCVCLRETHTAVYKQGDFSVKESRRLEGKSSFKLSAGIIFWREKKNLQFTRLTPKFTMTSSDLFLTPLFYKGWYALVVIAADIAMPPHLFCLNVDAVWLASLLHDGCSSITCVQGDKGMYQGSFP